MANYEKPTERWLARIGMKLKNFVVNGELKDVKEDKYTSDILYISYKPKWKWFRPPMFLKIWRWEISFLWAYNIDKAYILKDAYPTSIKNESDQSTDKSFNIEFEATKNNDIYNKIYDDEIKKRGDFNASSGENVTNGNKK